MLKPINTTIGLKWTYYAPLDSYESLRQLVSHIRSSLKDSAQESKPFSCQSANGPDIFFSQSYKFFQFNLSGKLSLDHNHHSSKTTSAIVTLINRDRKDRYKMYACMEEVLYFT